MLKGRSLVYQVFAAILAVTLGSVVVTGLMARRFLEAAFETYLRAAPVHAEGMMGPGMGRLILGAQERAFLGQVDRGIVLAAAIGVVAATVIAILLARYLMRPLEDLTDGAQIFAAGDLDHRVEPEGPAEVERLGLAFNDMAASLSEAERLRRRLVADVAHELRNPVAALRAQLEGMQEGVLDADEERLASVREDVEHLSRLVHDLQELSVAEAGRLHYEMGPLDIGPVVEREADRARSILAEGVEMRTACGPAHVLGDRRRLTQVLRNLLSNAARHTDEGHVEVSCAIDEGLVEVSVADTGEGIGEADLPYIFERFYRADTARAKDTGGSGIGLAISRRIVHDHGGVMFARSDPGAGSVVGFRLPLRG